MKSFFFTIFFFGSFFFFEVMIFKNDPSSSLIFFVVYDQEGMHLSEETEELQTFIEVKKKNSELDEEKFENPLNIKFNLESVERNKSFSKNEKKKLLSGFFCRWMFSMLKILFEMDKHNISIKINV